MTIFDELSGQIRALQRSPAIEVRFHNSTLADEAKAARVRRTLASIFDLEVAPSVAESVRIADNLYVYWKQKDAPDDDAVFGEFYLSTVLLFGPENELNAAFKSKTFDGMDLNDTRVFDHYKYNGGPIYALVPVRNGRIEEDVLIFNEKRLLKTALTYPTYLEALRLTRGVRFWQYLFCENPRVEPYEIDALAGGLAFIAQVFPGDDYRDLRLRLERLRKHG